MPGLVDILVGMKKGDSVTKTAKAPKDHSNEKMAGKTVKYEITLHDVKEEKLAEPNDDFAKEVGEGFETMLALRARIREDIEKAETETNLRNYETEVVDKLVEQASLEYAPQMVEHEIDHILNDQANLDPREPTAQMLYLQRLGKSEEEVRDSVREQATQRMLRSLVLSRFAEAENITVEDADIDAEIETMVLSSGEQGEMIRQLFDNENARDSLARSLHTRKTLARLVEVAEQSGSATTKKRAPAKKADTEEKTEDKAPAPKARRSAPRKTED
jgi:trigger factor